MEEFETLLNNTVPKIYSSVENRMKNGEVLRDPLSQLRKAFSAELDGFTITTSSEARSIDQLVEFEGRFSKLTPSLSVRNGQGELQYLISLDNQLSIATYHLNHAQTLEDLYNTSAFKNAKYNPLFAKSRIISYLFDQDGNRIPNRQIDLTNLSAYKEENGGRSKGTLERDLAERGKLIQDFYMMFLSGKTDIPRTETSHSFFSYAVKIPLQGRT
jgi:hypothetical protein